MSVNKEIKKVTASQIRKMKLDGEKISVLTAYDYTMARILDASGVDILLVGDSAGNVFAGYETTLPMTLDHMIYHTASVARGTKRAMVLADLPFGEYQGDRKSTRLNSSHVSISYAVFCLKKKRE